MSVKVANYQWHRRWHAKLMAHPGYQALTFEDRGVLDTLHNLAGHTNNNGSIRLGPAGSLKIAGLIDHLATAVPGSEKRRVRKSVERLIAAGLVTATEAGIIRITNWSTDQQAAPTAEAERKRKERDERERRTIRMIMHQAGMPVPSGAFPLPEENLRPEDLAAHLADQFGADRLRVLQTLKAIINVRLLSVDSRGNVRLSDVFTGIGYGRGGAPAHDTSAPAAANKDGGSAPLPPAQGSGSGSEKSVSGSECDMSHRGSVTCHTESETEVETEPEPERDAYASLNQEPERISGRFAQDAGGRGAEDRIWIDDPIDVAMRLCDEAGAFCRNSWRKKLRKLREQFGGDQVQAQATFRECLQVLAGMIREKKINTSRSQTLHGILNKRLEGHAP